MSMARTMAKVSAGIVGLLVLVGGGGFLWAKSASAERLSRTYVTHRVDIPVPFPLSEEELAALRAEKAAAAPADPAAPVDPAAPPADPLAGVDLDALARERAMERGKHLVQARYGCVECHGADFGGGTMIDAPPIGKILGRNITMGKGSVVTGYSVADWDRIVRHGVKPDGKPAAMPSADFFGMSDRELSDVIVYISAQPPVDKDVPPPTLGPVGTFLVATGEIRLSAEELGDHQKAHVVEPPNPEPTAAFGKHLAQVCTGCHRPDYSGGPVPGGDPSWPPARNLTPHAEGLPNYTFAEFEALIREGKGRSGQPVRQPMLAIAAYGKNMTDVEVKALYEYLVTVPPKPTSK